MIDKTKLRVVELFAGVGGFRLGFEQASERFKIAWSNQWEPSTKEQHASKIYEARFGKENHSNQDISAVSTTEIPDHEILAGGFPCQDYSVARTANNAKGLEGKKGVLWWDIHRILKEKTNPAKVVLLENVDRLLKSPTKQRGRDFAIMLASLADLGYTIEWRVINAADYGMPQRRRRVFIIAYHNSLKIAKEVAKLKNPFEWILEKGLFAKAFSVFKAEKAFENSFELSGDLAELSAEFNNGKIEKSPFENSGLVIGRKVYTTKTTPNYSGPFQTLGDIVLKERVPEKYYIDEANLEKWTYLKGAKNEERTNKSANFIYKYSEGSMIFPDPLDKPSRTIITGEGGASASRFKHVIRTKDGRLRRLTPIELERLNMFPDHHTEGVSDIKRAFFMGNALVVGIVEKLAKEIEKLM